MQNWKMKKSTHFDEKQKYEEDLFNLNLIFSKEVEVVPKKNVEFSLDADDIIKISDAYKVGALIIKSKSNPFLFLYAFIYAYGFKYQKNESKNKIEKYIKLIESDATFQSNAKNHKTYKYGKILINEKLNFLQKIKLLFKELKVV